MEEQSNWSWREFFRRPWDLRCSTFTFPFPDYSPGLMWYLKERK